MKKTLLTYSLLFFVLLVHADQDTISNTMSAEHQRIPGSSVCIVTPEDFTVSTNFSGFEHYEMSSSIMIVKIPGAASAILPALTPRALKGQGVDVKSSRDVLINGMTGKHIIGTQEAVSIKFIKHLIVFGDDKNVYMLMGLVPEQFKTEMENKLVASLLTVVVSQEAGADLRETLKYSIDEGSTGFQFVMSLGTSLLYSRDAKIPTEELDRASFLVSYGLYNKALSDDDEAKLRFASKRLKQLPERKNAKIESSKEVEISGLSGIELISDGINTKGIPTTTYQVILYAEDKYYIMVGTCTSDKEKNLKDFRHLVHSFSFK